MEGSVLEDLKIWTDVSDDLSISNTSSEEKWTRSLEVSFSPTVLGLSDCLCLVKSRTQYFEHEYMQSAAPAN